MTLLPADNAANVPAKVETPDLATQIVAMAANKDIDVAKLEKLIDMQERIMRRQSEEAFNRAFALMQSELPVIAASKTGDKWKYAPLEDIIEVVRPILQKHGFSLAHRTEWPAHDVLKVVGILSHVDGHSKESEFQSKADNSGSKNAIQGLGSANHYGRRYTTNDLLGIVTRDDDGRAARPEPVTDPEGFDDWMSHLESLIPDGLRTISDAFAKGSQAYREHLTKHYGRQWNDWKTKASKNRPVSR